MYTIITTLSCMGFSKKLSAELEGSTLLSVEEVLQSPEKLDGCEYLGLVFSNEGVEIPSEVEDLIFDVLRLNDRLKKIRYMFSICMYARSVGHALMIVEKLCRKFGHTPELNLSYKTRSKNNVDVKKALCHINSQDYLIANGRIGTSIYMASHAIWTGRLREEEKKIEELTAVVSHLEQAMDSMPNLPYPYPVIPTWADKTNPNPSYGTRNIPITEEPMIVQNDTEMAVKWTDKDGVTRVKPIYSMKMPKSTKTSTSMKTPEQWKKEKMQREQANPCLNLQYQTPNTVNVTEWSTMTQKNR